jgi:hypothetical protein
VFDLILNNGSITPIGPFSVSSRNEIEASRNEIESSRNEIESSRNEIEIMVGNNSSKTQCSSQDLISNGAFLTPCKQTFFFQKLPLKVIDAKIAFFNETMFFLA